jgi:hypothetical protein
VAAISLDTDKQQIMSVISVTTGLLQFDPEPSVFSVAVEKLKN